MADPERAQMFRQALERFRKLLMVHSDEEKLFGSERALLVFFPGFNLVEDGDGVRLESERVKVTLSPESAKFESSGPVGKTTLETKEPVASIILGSSASYACNDGEVLFRLANNGGNVRLCREYNGIITIGH